MLVGHLTLSMVLMEHACATWICDHKLHGVTRVGFIPLTVPEWEVRSPGVGRTVSLLNTLCYFSLQLLELTVMCGDLCSCLCTSDLYNSTHSPKRMRGHPYSHKDLGCLHGGAVGFPSLGLNISLNGCVFQGAQTYIS